MIAKLKKPNKTKPFVSSFRIDSEHFFDSIARSVKSKLLAKTCSRRAYGVAAARSGQ